MTRIAAPALCAVLFAACSCQPIEPGDEDGGPGGGVAGATGGGSAGGGSTGGGNTGGGNTGGGNTGGGNTGGGSAGGGNAGGGSAGGGNTGGGTADGGVDAGSVFASYDTLTLSYFDAPPPASGNFGPQFIRDVAFDAQGNIVVVGGTSASNFPTTPGAYDRVFGGPGTPAPGTLGDMDVFVSKFDRQGALLWSTLLGGPSYDRAYAVEVAANGDVIVAGRAGSGFPTGRRDAQGNWQTGGVMQTTFAGDTETNPPYGPQDGFIARLSGDGSRLLWSTFFGDTGRGFIRDIDLDSAGNVYAGLADVGGSFAFTPTQMGRRGALSGSRDAYLGKVSADGTTLLFGTYIGGSNGTVDGSNPSVRVAANGDVYFVTFTDSTNVDCVGQGAVPNVFQAQSGGALDMLLARFSATTHALVYCTYFGGNGDEGMETHSLAVDAQGNAYVTGGTSSTNLPTTVGAWSRARRHGFDGFIAKLSPDGRQLLASTYYNRPARAAAIQGLGLEGLALTADGDVVAGGSDRPNNTSSRQALFVRMSGDLGQLRHDGQIAGNGLDEFRALAVAPDGRVAYGGHTTSSNLPVTNAYDATYSCAPHNSGLLLLLQPNFR